MFLTHEMQNQLRETASFRSCKVIITDFQNVIFNTIDRNAINQQISRELLKILLDFSISSPSRAIIHNEDNYQIPILETDKNNPLINCCQIIMPIYRLNTLSGLLITFFNKQNFDYELQNSIIATKLLRQHIEHSIQGFHLNDLTEAENISKIFNDEYLSHVADLYDKKKSRLQKNKQYKRKKEKVSQLIETFEKTLSPEQQKIFDNILSTTYKLSDFDQALMYAVGIKYGAELSKI